MEETQNQENISPSSSNGVSFPTIGEPKKSSGAKTLLIVGILVLVAILGFVIYKSASNNSEESLEDETVFEDLTTPSSDQTVQTVTPASSPSPSVKVDKAKVTIQIQNGTGIPGEAAYLQTQLTTLGYSNIKVGNSDSTVTATTVTFSSTLDSTVVSEITQKLNSVYQTVTTKTATSATFDVAIVTGLRKGATAAPASTSAPSASTSPTPTRSPSPTP